MRQALRDVDGVVDANVSYDEKRAEVRYHPEVVDPAVMVEAVDGSVKKGGAEGKPRHASSPERPLRVARPRHLAAGDTAREEKWGQKQRQRCAPVPKGDPGQQFTRDLIWPRADAVQHPAGHKNQYSGERHPSLSCTPGPPPARGL